MLDLALQLVGQVGRARAARSSSGPSAARRGSCRPAPLSSLIRKTAIAVDRDQAARERRLGDADHRVERVAVLAERVGDEAVVGRVDDRGEQEPVELDAAELLVPLVLVARPLRDLDEAVQGFVHAVRTIDSEMLKGFRDFVMRGNVDRPRDRRRSSAPRSAPSSTAFSDRLHRRAARRARRHARLRRRRRHRQRLEDRLRLDAHRADPVPDRRRRHLLRHRRAGARDWPSGAARRESESPAPSDETKLLTEIRDLLADAAALARARLALGQQAVAPDVAAGAADADVDGVRVGRLVAQRADRRRVDAREVAGPERDARRRRSVNSIRPAWTK